MTLTPIASNMTEISDGRFRLLFSYSTPVACWTRESGFSRTRKKWSQTTTRHINKWLDGRDAQDRSQELFDNLLQVDVLTTLGD